VLPDPRKGVIGFWSGSIASIPNGWLLCDGTHGTPDLRNEFVVAAGDTYNPADSAGSVNHNHNFTSNSHNHTFRGGSDLDSGSDFDYDTDSKTAGGTTDNGSSLPPYYSLCKIMFKG